MKNISILMPNLKGGGAERVYVNLANNWIKKGYSIEFILMKNDGEFKNLLSDKIKITNLNVTKLRNTFFPLVRYFKKNIPEIILVAMWPLTSYSILAWLFSGKRGKLFVSDHVHLTTAASNEINVSKLYLKLFIKITYPFANGIITVSNGVKKNLIEIGNLNSSKIKVIYNPIFQEIKNSPKNISQIKLWGGNFKHKLLSVGTLKKQKDHKTLIKAISYLPKDLDVKLVILGEGENRSKLTTLIKKLDLSDRVDLPGFTIDPEPWYNTADLFILSSLWEGFGNVLVEAMKYGLPLISTDCNSGPSEILENGKYGVLVPISDPKILSEAIKKSISKKHNKLKLKERAKYFSIEKASKSYIDFMTQ